MNWKESTEGHMGEFGGRKVKWEVMLLYYNFKNIKEPCLCPMHSFMASVLSIKCTYSHYLSKLLILD